MKQLTEDEFREQFDLIDNPFDENAGFDGKMFETYGEELHYVLAMARMNRVITIIETDGDEDEDEDEAGLNMCYASGYHLVNRMGYLITEVPIRFDFEVKLED